MQMLFSFEMIFGLSPEACAPLGATEKPFTECELHGKTMGPLITLMDDHPSQQGGYCRGALNMHAHLNTYALRLFG